jgi:hypothetical protein
MRVVVCTASFGVSAGGGSVEGAPRASTSSAFAGSVYEGWVVSVVSSSGSVVSVPVAVSSSARSGSESSAMSRDTPNRTARITIAATAIRMPVRRARSRFAADSWATVLSSLAAL